MDFMKGVEIYPEREELLQLITSSFHRASNCDRKATAVSVVNMVRKTRISIGNNSTNNKIFMFLKADDLVHVADDLAGSVHVLT